MDFRDSQSKIFEHGWSMARNQLITYLFSQLENEKKRRKWTVLDIGCGTGEQLGLYKKFKQVIGLDINPVAKQVDGSIIIADIETYPLAINSYELICCFDILEHLKNDVYVLEHCWRGLKPGGYLLLTVPAYNWLFSSHDRALLHKRRYYYRELKNKLKSANFTILKIHYWNSLLFLPIVVMRLIKKILNLPENSELTKLPNLLNIFIYRCLLLDNWLIKHHCHLPCGLTIFAVVKKT